MNGKKIKGYLDVNTKREVMYSLREQGYFLINCCKCKNKIFISPTLKCLSFICNSLSLMLSSGMNICQSLNITASQVYNKHVKNSLYTISENIAQGQSLFESMKVYPKIYPVFMLQMINVGEESGRLEEILKELSEYYEKLQEITSKTKNSLIYPLTVFITSILIVTFFIIKIIPSFISTLNSLGGNTPIITKILLNTSNFLCENYIYINTILLIVVVSICFYIKTEHGERNYHLLKLKLPLFKTMYKKVVLYKFCITMSILDSSGFNIIKSLEISADVVGNRIIGERILKTMKDIRDGNGIYSSLKRNEVGSCVMLSLIKVGEETGNIDKMFNKSAYILQEDVKNRLKFLVSIIEPVTILLLSLFVGAFIVAALLPIFNIMDTF